MVVSTTAIGGAPAQTPENTTAPHESLPQASPVKKKTVGFTKEMRDAKIASGWIPPEKRQKPQKQVAAEDLALLNKTMAAEQSTQQAVKETEGDIVLRDLVRKLVELENNEQYVSVWTHFFTHGGVYNGPRYLDELNAAVAYLVKRGL